MKEFCLPNRELLSMLVESSGKKGDRLLRLRPTGSSMAPFICEKDTLLIRLSDRATAPRFGDVVIARIRNKIVIHRIIGRNKSNYLIKGDNLRHPDGWIKCGQIFGVVEGTSPKRPLGFRPHRFINTLMALGSRLNLYSQAYRFWSWIKYNGKRS